VVALLRFTSWAKALQATALAVAVTLSMGASNDSGRFHDLSHRLMCTCGCAQMLGECNQMGCAESARAKAELTAAIASGKTDQQILDTFAVRYGATVLAAPTTKGFDLVAWIAPIAVFAAALMGTILLVRRWSVGRMHLPALPDSAEIDVLRRQIRHETEQDIDGGF